MTKIKFKKNTVSIIAYHYVREIKKSNYPNLKGIEYNLYKKQINYFKKNFNIISAEDLNYLLNSKKKVEFKKPLLMLTFDDGYIDHYEYVFPTLIKNKIKGCFYPPVKIFKDKMLNVNKIHFILEMVKNRNIILNDLILFVKKKYNINLKNSDFSKIINFSKKLSKKIPEFDDKQTIIIKKLLQIYLPNKVRNVSCDYLFNKFVKIKEKNLANKTYVNIKKLREMKENGMHIGCHGVDHQRWDKWSFKNQEKEILQSKNFFKKNGLYSDTFSVCYPWGSYNRNSKNVLKKLSVSFGLTSDTGNFFINSKYNRYLLPRYDANEFKNI